MPGVWQGEQDSGAADVTLELCPQAGGGHVLQHLWDPDQEHVQIKAYNLT